MASASAAAGGSLVDNRSINYFDGLDEQIKKSNRGRKRKANPDKTKRQIAKQKRYSGEGRTARISCNHKDVGAKKSFCRAQVLSENTLNLGWTNFHASQVKYDQDVIISNLMDVSRAERPRVGADARQKPRALTVKYHLRNYDVEGSPMVPVCKATFMSALGE